MENRIRQRGDQTEPKRGNKDKLQGRQCHKPIVRIMNKGEKKKGKQADMPKESGSPHDKQKNGSKFDQQGGGDRGESIQRAITGRNPKY